MTYDLSNGRVSPDPYPEGFLGLLGDGYDQMGFLRNRGWRTVSAWGKDGWDLGDWPYVMVYMRTVPLKHPDKEGHLGPERPFEVLVVTEGDNDRHAFTTLRQREEWVDAWALWFWKAHNKPWATQESEADLKGPWRRSA